MAPIPISQTPTPTVAPSPLVLEPTKAVTAIILSTAILHYHFLTEFLRQTFLHTTFFERDLTTTDDTYHEGDIILSPNRCIIFFSLAQITQKIPSYTSNKILAVASKYRQLEILITCPGTVNGKDIALFS